MVVKNGVYGARQSERGNALSSDDDPDLTTRRHSLNLAWAAASCA